MNSYWSAYIGLPIELGLLLIAIGLPAWFRLGEPRWLVGVARGQARPCLVGMGEISLFNDALNGQIMTAGT